jgi:hypothetical protein
MRLGNWTYLDRSAGPGCCCYRLSRTWLLWIIGGWRGEKLDITNEVYLDEEEGEA